MPSPQFTEDQLRQALRADLADIRYSDAAKENLISTLTAATNSPRTRARLRVAAASTAAALLVLGGGAAVAVNSNDALRALVAQAFPGLAVPTEVVDKIGHPIGATSVSNGVRVTADAIIGDEHTYAISYTIAKEDGTPFDNLPPLDNGKYALVFDDWETEHPGGKGMSGSTYFYDANPSDPAIQMMTRNSVFNDKPLNGTATHVFLHDLLLVDGFADPQPEHYIAQGTWHLAFKLGYEDSSITVPAGKPASDAPQPTTVDAIRLSPISATVEYSATGASDPGPGAGEVHVLLRDGTVVSTESGGLSCETRGDVTRCTANHFLSQITDTADVAAVVVGGTEFPVR